MKNFKQNNNQKFKNPIKIELCSHKKQVNKTYIEKT